MGQVEVEQDLFVHGLRGVEPRIEHARRFERLAGVAVILLAKRHAARFFARSGGQLRDVVAAMNQFAHAVSVRRQGEVEAAELVQPARLPAGVTVGLDERQARGERLVPLLRLAERDGDPILDLIPPDLRHAARPSAARYSLSAAA